MAIEETDGTTGDATVLTVHLGQHTVARDKGDLHAGKEGGKRHGDNKSDDEF